MNLEFCGVWETGDGAPVVLWTLLEPVQGLQVHSTYSEKTLKQSGVFVPEHKGFNKGERLAKDVNPLGPKFFVRNQMQPSTAYHLSTMTLAYLRHAVVYAKDGRKDQARDWLRFVEQSDLLTLLKDQGVNVQEHEDTLKLLADLCHPQASPSVKGELERVADVLERVEDFLNQQPVMVAERFDRTGRN